MWPFDKTSVINTAAIQTGNNAVNVADDGSEEWDHGSAAYELALPYAIEQKNWKFETTVTTLTSTGIAPADPLFDTAYARPPNAAHLIWVRMNNVAVEYRILDNQIVLNNTGNQAVTAKFVKMPDGSSLAEETPTFVLALLAFVKSGIYRGLNENIEEADKMWAFGEKLLSNAASRADQEEPKRAMFNSRLAASRRVRRPWPQTPTGWSGTGIPG
jgi:hypothetical protein